MSSFPKSIGLLSGVVAFCVAALVGLSRASAPLTVMKKAAICALVLGLVGRIGANLALKAVRDGLRQYERERMP